MAVALKYSITILNQSSLKELFAGPNGPTYGGLFRDMIYGERPALRYEDRQLFAWNRNGTTANAATISTFIPPDGVPRPMFHALDEDVSTRQELLRHRFMITHDSGLRFHDTGAKHEPNSFCASVDAGWDAHIIYRPPAGERANLFISPLTFTFDMTNELHKGTLRFLLEDDGLKDLALVLPPRPIFTDHENQSVDQLYGTDPRLESLRNRVSSHYSQVESPPAGVVALECLRNPYIRDAVTEGAYLRFTDTPYGRKLQLAVPKSQGPAQDDIARIVRKYRLDFLTDDAYYTGWRKEVREDLLKPIFKHFAVNASEERVCEVEHINEEAILRSNSLQRFTEGEVSRRLEVYRGAARSSEYLDNLPGQFKPHAVRAQEVRGVLREYESQLWNVWETSSPESYRFLQELTAGLDETEIEVVNGLISEVYGITNIGLVISIFWPVLRSFLGLDLSRAVSSLGLPETYAAFLESLGMLADHGTALAVDYFLDNSRMVEPGSGRADNFIGPLDSFESESVSGYPPQDSPLAIYHSQTPSCLRATILLHLLCPLSVRILPGASFQTKKELEDPNRARAWEFLRTIAQFQEGLGYIVGGEADGHRTVLSPAADRLKAVT